MSEIDILSIHGDIQKQLTIEKDMKTAYIDKIDSYKSLKDNWTFSSSFNTVIDECIKEYQYKMEEISEYSSYYYLLHAQPIIEKYKTVISEPKKISFFNKKTSNPEYHTTKSKLIKEYLEMACNFADISHYIQKNQSDKNINAMSMDTCKECGGHDIDIQDAQIYICNNCGAQEECIGYDVSFKDITRVNISNKFIYDRRLHFKDCINQYQGKQTSVIDRKVYDDLVTCFENHELVVKGKEGYERFSKITKDHILLFLKDCGYAKHYEDITLIHCTLTGIKPDDISDLEQQLLSDFDDLSSLYTEKFIMTNRIDRKSFINSQYVLYHLLQKYKHPCKKEDFNILKTLERKALHDQICAELFGELGWNFSAT